MLTDELGFLMWCGGKSDVLIDGANWNFYQLSSCFLLSCDMYYSCGFLCVVVRSTIMGLTRKDKLFLFLMSGDSL